MYYIIDARNSNRTLAISDKIMSRRSFSPFDIDFWSKYDQSMARSDKR